MGCIISESRIVIVISLLLLISICSPGLSQTVEVRENLSTGQYSVGFGTIEKYDYSRTFRPKLDYFGVPLEGVRARPVQICYWYPTAKAANAEKMVYGEYQFAYPKSPEFIDFLSRIQVRDITNLHIIFNNDQGFVLDYLSIESAAVKDAPPADGSFPLLIYCPDYRGYYTENLLLCEYLAGSGFVVVTTHASGTKTVNAELNSGDIETLIEDKQFILGALRDLSFIDMNKIGIVGYGSGGLEAMLLPMRNSDIDASLSIQGLFNLDNAGLIKQFPHFRDANFTIPFMQIYSAGFDNFDTSIVGSLRYARRYSLAFSDMPAGGFTGYRLMSLALPDSPVENGASLETGYRVMSLYIRNFFDAYLNGNAASADFLLKAPAANGIKPDYLDIVISEKQQLPPTTDQFMAIITQKGIDTALALYEQFKQAGPERIFFEEGAMNILGYRLLQNGQIAEAICVFKINTEAYPNSANTWDSYGEALIASGETEPGKQALRKALEILPSDTTSGDDLKEAIRAHANQVLGETDDK